MTENARATFGWPFLYAKIFAIRIATAEATSLKNIQLNARISRFVLKIIARLSSTRD